MKISVKIMCCTALCLALTFCMSGCIPTVFTKWFINEKVTPTSCTESTTPAEFPSESLTEAAETPGTTAYETENFEQFAGKYAFSSGVGAWGNTLTLNPDGSFEGKYHDSDMALEDETGEPYGIVYECEYTGAFSSPEKLDEYSYRAEITEFSRKGNVGDEYTEYIGSTRLVHRISHCYGLEEEGKTAQEVIFYTEGTPTSMLSEDALSWLHLESDASSLPFSVIYCPDFSTAFVSIN
ncbi:MAG: hypothetical protein Q4D44_00575 [Eubacteriales bacterium]|nr:hypothetical protein [Eubacteriales bacterium]